MFNELKPIFIFFTLFLVVCFSVMTYLGYQMIEIKTERVEMLKGEIIEKHEAGDSVTSELRQYTHELSTLEKQHNLLYTWYFKYLFDYPERTPMYWDRHNSELIIGERS
ncbi:hypothetical protein BTR22_12065 [Alkalihalophilus pseudofirmus]|jgi:hypothetical protein|uniref:Septum formation initiator n=1 Tax=Alkalihalophilus marmarensis DSM 21297 TaxID=1188261 RepID=U6SKB6_9BACI|nr:hypothetical protein [Alkalihalophilus marmarensis]ERN51335.1 hypothetical protein A33I_01265 [Alkalihalophilus marmarensis DSM 21297]MCM3490455.1 hypothetical protein [Alkalihalophilus marmarensis]MED1602800.1 hypothetical protein [Alkalihalophilus marmarensis]OLS36235.1 hypothetical protein BTR22_12065 [Alkalihalophilus pseudofirmus]